LGVVKIVLAGLANISLAPAIRGSLLVLSVPSDCGSDFEQPASVKAQIIAANKMPVRDAASPRVIVRAFILALPPWTQAPRA